MGDLDGATVGPEEVGFEVIGSIIGDSVGPEVGTDDAGDVVGKGVGSDVLGAFVGTCVGIDVVGIILVIVGDTEGACVNALLTPKHASFSRKVVDDDTVNAQMTLRTTSPDPV